MTARMWRVVYEDRTGGEWEERVEHCRTEAGARRFAATYQPRHTRNHRIEVTDIEWRPVDHLV